MGTIYIYDGTAEGLFTAVAVAIKSKEQPEAIFPNGFFQGGLFDHEFNVGTDEDQVGRLWQYLNSKLRKTSVRHILKVILSDLPDKEMVVHNYIKASLKLGRKLDKHHTLDSVRTMHEYSQKVSVEIHRFKGLLRFRQLQEKILYAPFYPDHRIVYPLAEHFKRRLGAEKWIIHDLKHQMAVFWNGDTLHEVDMDPEFLDKIGTDGEIDKKFLAKDEIDYQKLWQTFFKHISIVERQNPKLQRQFMPQRYWSFLVEMNK